MHGVKEIAGTYESLESNPVIVMLVTNMCNTLIYFALFILILYRC